jgi:hypothetical protein
MELLQELSGRLRAVESDLTRLRAEQWEEVTIEAGFEGAGI